MGDFIVKKHKIESPPVPEGFLLGMGNPLLDISAVVPQSVLDKYGVKLNDAILAEEKHMPIYDELVKNYKVDYIAGGATQNSIRVAQWMMQSPNATTFLGSIGKNCKFGKQLQDAAARDGVKALYYESDKPTGTCAVLVKDGERSLVTNLSAANEYKHAHTTSSKSQQAIEKAQMYYAASFFLTVPDGPKSLLYVAEHAKAHNKVLAINLSAPFLIQVFYEQMEKVIPFADFVFGNESEATELCKKLGWDENDLSKAALRLAAQKKENGSRCRTVIFTQGADPTIVAHDGMVTLYPVAPLSKDAIVDSNGAGDAFVGGFLAALAKGKPIADCVQAGHYSARVIIQRAGCTFPPQPDI